MDVLHMIMLWPAAPRQPLMVVFEGHCVLMFRLKSKKTKVELTLYHQVQHYQNVPHLVYWSITFSPPPFVFLSIFLKNHNLWKVERSST